MTKLLDLERIAYMERHTIGRIVHPELPAIYTLERPWIPNPAGKGGTLTVSCVPDGRYVLRPHSTDKFPNVWALTNEGAGVYYQERPVGQAWGRTAILIHAANQVSDVIGCIGVGMRYAIYSDTVTLLRSQEALNALRALLGKTGRHELVIRPTSGTGE